MPGVIVAAISEPREAPPSSACNRGPTADKGAAAMDDSGNGNADLFTVDEPTVPVSVDVMLAAWRAEDNTPILRDILRSEEEAA